MQQPGKLHEYDSFDGSGPLSTRGALGGDMPIFGGRGGSKQTRSAYKQSIQAWASKSDAGCYIRGEVPTHLSAFLWLNSRDWYPDLPDGADAKTVQERELKKRHLQLKNHSNKKVLDQARRAAQIHLSAQIFKVMQLNDTPLVDAWRLEFLFKQPEGDAEPDLTLSDGMQMFKALLAHLDGPATIEDHEMHEKGVMNYKYTKMPNNISAAAWSARIASCETDHNRHLGNRRMVDSSLTQFYLKHMPDNLNQLRITLQMKLEAEDRWADSDRQHDHVDAQADGATAELRDHQRMRQDRQRWQPRRWHHHAGC